MSTPHGTVLAARGLTKTFPGVRALGRVDLDLRPGRVHALLGENGAGKSTLVKILTGTDQPDGGELHLDGAAYQPNDPRAALALGVLAVYQELSLLPAMSVLDNVMLGQEHRRRGLLDRRSERTAAREALARVGLGDLDTSVRVGDLSLANQQLVEIARALIRRSRVLILDEPSAVLPAEKRAALHDVVRSLTADGVAILYITHLLDEVEALADDVTVVRDGVSISSGPASEYPVTRIIREMVGREVDTVFPPVPQPRAGVVLSVQELVPDTDGTPPLPVSFEARAGEIVGLAGLMGAGRSRLLRTMAGARGRAGGVIRSGGAEVGTSVRAAVGAGVVLVPEERKTDGLVLPLTVAVNTTLTALPSVSRWGWLAKHIEETAFSAEKERFGIRASSPQQTAGQLSGGNQQKIVLAKWVRTQPKVLLLDEPTRGVDVGAKAEIYRIIAQLAAEGMTVVMASSDLPEILGLAHRVLVFRDGAIAGELSGDDIHEETIMHLALDAPDSGAAPETPAAKEIR